MNIRIHVLTIIFTFILVILLIDNSSSVGVLEVQLKNMYVENMNSDLCVMNASTVYYNRTMKIPRMALLFKRDVSKTEVHLEVFQWRDNQFKKFTPIEVRGYLNTLIQSKMFDIENVCRNYWKPPLVPPLKANVSYVQGQVVIGNWPVYLPEGQWKVNLHFYLRNNQDRMGTIVIEVTTAKKYD